jgi:tetratricopeptide (TPR) repeat protein
LYVYPLLRGRYVKALVLGLAVLLCVFLYYGITWTWSSGDAIADNENSESSLRQKVLPSIVTIQSDGGRGTGFVIENGLVVTAYHVAPTGQKTTVVFQDGERAKVVEHIACDPERDLAVLRIDTKRKLEPLELAGALPAVGEPVASFQPGGGELRGEVLDSGDEEVVLRIAGQVILRTTLKAVPGWSGSPVVNMEGRVVGIAIVLDGATFKAVGIHYIGSGTGAVPVTVLRALLGIPQLDEAIRLHPGSAERYHDRASLHCYNGDLDKAIADYAEAIRLKPEYAEAYCNRGQAYARKGDFDKAVADYTKAIDLGRKTFEEYQARAAAYDKKGDRSKALRDYTEAIRLKPQTPALYRLRCFVYAASGAHEQAIADLTEAIRLEQSANPGIYPTARYSPDDWRRYRWAYCRLVEKVLLSTPGVAHCTSVAGLLRMKPGATEFTVMPNAPNSCASCRVSPITAFLEVV